MPAEIFTESIGTKNDDDVEEGTDVENEAMFEGEDRILLLFVSVVCLAEDGGEGGK